MPSLKDVLEATLAEAEFDLGEREMTRHGPRTTWRGRPDEIVSAAELHRLAKTDSWEDELSLQARGANVVAPADALARLHGCVEEVLGEYIDPQSGGIGHAFPMGSANHGSSRIKEGGVASQSYASPTAEFARLLVRGCAIMGTEALAGMLTRWAGGEPVRYRTAAVLNGLYLEGSVELLPGVRLDPLPKSSDGAFGTTPIRFGSSIAEYLGRTVLRVDSTAAPAFYRPKKGGVSDAVEARFVPDVSLDDICHALALESDGEVRTAIEWNDYGELSLCLSPVSGGSHSRGRGGLDGRPIGFSTNMDFETGVLSIEISQEHISELSAQRVGAAIESIVGYENSQFRVALSRWCKSRESFATMSDRFIDLRVALEALYLKKFKGEQNQEMTFRLGLFGAWHLGGGAEERKDIRRMLRDVYTLGSRAVHGQELKSDQKNRRLLSDGQKWCRLGMLKILEEGEPDDWEELILGDEGGSTGQ